MSELPNVCVCAGSLSSANRLFGIGGGGGGGGGEGEKKGWAPPGGGVLGKG